MAADEVAGDGAGGAEAIARRAAGSGDPGPLHEVTGGGAAGAPATAGAGGDAGAGSDAATAEAGAGVGAGAADVAGREWYRDGLQFSCTQCGNCCTGPPGAVWFEPEECRAMAAALGMDERAFLRRYARRIGRRWSLREVERDGKFDCTLLERRPDGSTGCSVYRARPTQCRTWPFWPDLLASREAWDAARRGTPCPGMGRGELIPVERIRIIRDEQAGADERIARGGRTRGDTGGG